MEKRIQSIIKNHNIDIEVLSDFIGAVVIAERLYGDNKFEVDIDRFASQFTNFGFKANTNEGISFLPKVQIMRIFVDSIGLYLSRKDKRIEGLHLTMPSSKVVGTGRILTGVSQYSDESECEKMLKLLEQQAKSSIDIDNLLSELSNLVPNNIKQNINLPTAYLESAERYGFKCSKTSAENPLVSLVDSLVVFMLRTETLYYSMRIDMNSKSLKSKLVLVMSNNIYNTYTRNKYLSRALGKLFNITLLSDALTADTVLTLYKLAFS